MKILCHAGFHKQHTWTFFSYEERTHRLLAPIEELWVGDGVAHVGLDNVETQSTGRLIGHLDTVLQDGHWECVRWVGGQPQAEVRMSGFRVKFLGKQKVSINKNTLL